MIPYFTSKPKQTRESSCFIKKCFILFIIFELSLVSYAQNKDKLSYLSFVDYAKAGKVKSMKIGGKQSWDMTVTIKDSGKESTYKVDRPFDIDEDVVFIDFLKKNKIPYESFKRDYSSMSPFNLFYTFAVVLLPYVIVILALITMIKVLKRTKSLESLLTEMKSNINKLQKGQE